MGRQGACAADSRAIVGDAGEEGWHQSHDIVHRFKWRLCLPADTRSASWRRSGWRSALGCLCGILHPECLRSNRSQRQGSVRSHPRSFALRRDQSHTGFAFYRAVGYADHSAVLRRRNVQILIGPDASAVALKNSAAGCTHLHLSCHSRFDWSAPQKSGFVLANGEVFTLSQISADLSLDKCELVFAAGCETGNSDPSNAPQEAIGQVSSFLQAGAAGVVATLWPLYDDAAALLTAKFYELHIGKSMTAAYALREAALSMRRLRPAEYRSMMARHFGASDSRSMRGFLLMEKLRNEVGSGEKHAPGFEEEEVPFDHPLIWAPFTAWGRHIRADDRLQTK